ncbi:MAG: hypothetical protein NT138_16560 [Planctomycetales bacterium]|nr:hypothetical protein [Planctomycetales bacterium]
MLSFFKAAWRKPSGELIAIQSVVLALASNSLECRAPMPTEVGITGCTRD